MNAYFSQSNTETGSTECIASARGSRCFEFGKVGWVKDVGIWTVGETWGRLYIMKAFPHCVYYFRITKQLERQHKACFSYVSGKIKETLIKEPIDRVKEIWI